MILIDCTQCKGRLRVYLCIFCKDTFFCHIITLVLKENRSTHRCSYTFSLYSRLRGVIALSLLHAHTYAVALVVYGLFGSTSYLDVELSVDEHAREVALAAIDGE